MASFSNFMTRVVPRAMGVAEPVARQAILDTAIEFCELTNTLQVVPAAIDVLADTYSYTPTLNVGTVMHGIRKAWLAGSPLAVPANDAIAVPFAYGFTSSGDLSVTPGTPTDAFVLDGEVALYPPPDRDISAGLILKLAVKPDVDAQDLPDELYDSWRDAIVSGALARLLTIRGTVHYDPQEAARYETTYRRYINHARIQARLGNSASELRVSHRAFA